MATYIQIGSTVTVGAGGAANIDFTSIPSTYTDLLVKVSARNTAANYWDNINITFNGSTTGYTQKIVASADGSVTSAGVTVSAIYYLYSAGASATSNTFANGEIYIPNYAGSNNKSVSIDTVTENNGTQILLGLTAGLWSNTSAINRVTLTPSNGNLAQYSTASIYGIKNS